MSLEDQQDELNKQLRELAKFIVHNFIDNTDNTQKAHKHEPVDYAERLNLVLQGVIQSVKLNDGVGNLKTVRKKLESLNVNNLFNNTEFDVQDYDRLLEFAVDALEADDIESAKYVLSTLTHIFPFQAQTYILIASLIWKEEGIEKAAEFYNHLSSKLDHPLICFYAAECFAGKGDLARSRQLLSRASVLCDEGGSDFAPLKKEIQDLAQALSH